MPLSWHKRQIRDLLKTQASKKAWKSAGCPEQQIAATAEDDRRVLILHAFNSAIRRGNTAAWNMEAFAKALTVEGINQACPPKPSIDGSFDETTGVIATPLITAISAMNSEAVMNMVRLKADVNLPNASDAFTPLFFATHFARRGATLVRVLIDAKADVNKVNGEDCDGQSPMHAAAAFGAQDAAKLLLHHKASVNVARLSDGITPLHQAVIHGRKSMVQFLLQNGAKINAKTTDNQAQAIHHACLGGDLRMVQLLVEGRSNLHTKIDYGKDAKPPVHAVDDDSLTPLMLACSRCHYEVSTYLIEHHRADYMHKSVSFQYTALDYAKHGMRGSRNMSEEDIKKIVKEKKKLVDYLIEAEKTFLAERNQQKSGAEDLDFDFLDDHGAIGEEPGAASGEESGHDDDVSVGEQTEPMGDLDIERRNRKNGMA